MDRQCESELRHAGLDHERKLHAALRLITEALLDDQAQRHVDTEHQRRIDNQTLERFGTAVEEGRRLRRQLHEAREKIESLRRRETELLQRVHQLEAMLQNPAPGDRDWRDLDRLMRTAPTARG